MYQVYKWEINTVPVYFENLPNCLGVPDIKLYIDGIAHKNPIYKTRMQNAGYHLSLYLDIFLCYLGTNTCICIIRFRPYRLQSYLFLHIFIFMTEICPNYPVLKS